MNNRSQRAASPVLDAKCQGFSSRGSAQAEACGSGWLGNRFAVFALGLMIFSTILVAGCHPWAHPGVRVPMGEPVTTPSWDSAFAVEREPREAHRDFDKTVLATRDGSVTHGPLYFEDASVVLPTDSDAYGWSYDDFLYMYYGPFRFLANMAFFPVSAVDTPPWSVMVSDGRPSRKFLGTWHDSAKVE